MWSELCVAILFLVCVQTQSYEADLVAVPRVTIAQGVVIGSLAEDGDYYEFHGIPYADSTSGSHRFKAPSPPPLFTDAFVANRKNVRCVHSLGVGYEGTEDCLVANVFTPDVNATQPLPVMVWIKGKEFDKEYEQKFTFRNFMDHDVVVVSLNFRESILGFLCLGTETAPGNAGLKDIIAGLKWVQENIAEFGGDASSVTLFGHGSGAAAIDLVSMSRMAERLVHKVISQSGTASAPWAVTRENLKYAIKVAEELGHDANSVEELSEIYTKTSVATLMAVINDLDLKDNALAFAPCVEKNDTDLGEPFMIKSPYEILSNNDFLAIPFMTGVVDNEGTIRASEAIDKDWLEKMSESFDEFLQSDLDFDSEEEKRDASQLIKSYYFDSETVEFENYLKYQGDTLMLISALREVEIRSRMSSQPVYLYQFSYKGSLGGMFVGPLQLDTAEHSEELSYMFFDSTQQVNLKDLNVSDLLLQRWTNFAKNGIPSANDSNIEWLPFTKTDSNFLRFIDDAEYNEEQGGKFEILAQNPHANEMSFWEPIYEQHFLDARSFWGLNGRDEDNVTTEGTPEGTTEGTTTVDPIETTTPAPSPPPLFTDAFVANRKNVRCVHSLGVGYEGTEDCLVANVFTPDVNATQPLPVMVWIKGKEFDKEYEQKFTFRNFMDHDVVVVSLNFRESILGFLCLGTETAPGNAGLKDIIAGLKWVQENIAEFGGDASSVTLFGHGSGAAAIDLVSMSRMAERLVHKVISQSGTASAPWAVTRENLKYAIKVAEELGHDANSVEELSEIYTKTSVATLMAVINDLDLKDNALAFAPCVEKNDTDLGEPFMIKSPYEILSNNDFLAIPFMTGVVDNEGTIRASEAIDKDWLEKMSESFDEFLQSDLDFDSEEEKRDASQLIKSYYFDSETVEFENYLKYQGDTLMLISALREVEIRSRMSSQPVYLYQFSYKGSLGGMFVGPLQLDTAEHSEELSYMFFDSTQQVNLKDLNVSDLLLQRWTNFAKNGIPSANDSNIEWLPFTKTDSNFLRFIDDAEYNEEQGGKFEILAQNPHANEMSFWEPIYEQHFLDARSFWGLNGRDEDNVTTEGTPEGTTEGTTTVDPIETTTPVTDSASTAFGYTFTITAIFTILNHLHSSLISS